MKSLCLSLVCLLAIGSASGRTTRAPDEICKNADMFGVIEMGCWGYKECVNGAYIEHKCADGYVFDKDTRTCHIKGTQSNDCDKPTDCTALPDAYYSDYRYNCKAYYRCYGEINIGQFYCNGDLVFNEEIQVCDFRSDVLPPCGTKRPETTTVK